MELEYYLFHLGLKQQDFAEKIGCSKHTLSAILRGQRHPSLTLALKIFFETYGLVSLVDLLDEKNLNELKKKYGNITEDIVYIKGRKNLRKQDLVKYVKQ